MLHLNAFLDVLLMFGIAFITSMTFIGIMAVASVILKNKR